MVAAPKRSDSILMMRGPHWRTRVAAHRQPARDLPMGDACGSAVLLHLNCHAVFSRYQATQGQSKRTMDQTGGASTAIDSDWPPCGLDTRLACSRRCIVGGCAFSGFRYVGCIFVLVGGLVGVVVGRVRVGGVAVVGPLVLRVGRGGPVSPARRSVGVRGSVGGAVRGVHGGSARAWRRRCGCAVGPGGVVAVSGQGEGAWSRCEAAGAAALALDGSARASGVVLSVPAFLCARI